MGHLHSFVREPPWKSFLSGSADASPVLAGILFQLGTMTIFTVLALDFILRVIAHRPYAHRHSRTIVPTDPPATLPSSETEQEGEGAKEKDTFTPTEAYQTTPTNLRHAQLLLAGIAFASTMIYVRGVYRSIELAQGWSGYLITHENYFTYLDGLPMALCFSAFAALHPGWLLPRREGWKNA